MRVGEREREREREGERVRDMGRERIILDKGAEMEGLLMAILAPN